MVLAMVGGGRGLVVDGMSSILLLDLPELGKPSQDVCIHLFIVKSY